MAGHTSARADPRRLGPPPRPPGARRPAAPARSAGAAAGRARRRRPLRDPRRRPRVARGRAPRRGRRSPARSSRPSASTLGPDKEFVITRATTITASRRAGSTRACRASPPASSGSSSASGRTARSRALAEAARPARLQFAYPGLWLRDDVYAFHGHYADRPRHRPDLRADPRRRDGQMDRAAPRQRDARRLRGRALARSTPGCTRSRSAPTTRSCPRAAARRRARTRRSRPSAPPRALVLQDRLPRGGARPQPRRPRPAAVEPVTDGAAARLPHGIPEVGPAPGRRRRDYVIWGHSHRSGPWPGDDLAEWHVNGTRIVNTGSWVYQPHFLTPEPNGSPYWPGTAVLVDDDGPPQLLRLLGDRGHAELRPRGPG